jgi:AcrR family transcriptional regulator
VKEFKTAKSKDTYNRVLTSAMRLFSEKGYEKATMRGISKEAKLGLGALYYYFPSKESIVTTFYEQLQSEIAEEWTEKDPRDADLGTRLRAFLIFKLQKLEPYRPLMRILLKEAVDPESALNPLSAESKSALDQSLEVFSGMVDAGEHSQQVAKLLWLGHLALIGLWIHKPEKIDKAIIAFADMAPFLSLTLASGPAGRIIDDVLSGD